MVTFLGKILVFIAVPALVGWLVWDLYVNPMPATTRRRSGSRRRGLAFGSPRTMIVPAPEFGEYAPAPAAPVPSPPARAHEVDDLHRKVHEVVARLGACERASSDLQSALLKANARMDAHEAVPTGPVDLSGEMQRMTAASATQEGRLSELEHITRSLSRAMETQERRIAELDGPEEVQLENPETNQRLEALQRRFDQRLTDHEELLQRLTRGSEDSGRRLNELAASLGSGGGDGGEAVARAMQLAESTAARLAAMAEATEEILERHETRLATFEAAGEDGVQPAGPSGERLSELETCLQGLSEEVMRLCDQVEGQRGQLAQVGKRLEGEGDIDVEHLSALANRLDGLQTRLEEQTREFQGVSAHVEELRAMGSLMGQRLDEVASAPAPSAASTQPQPDDLTQIRGLGPASQDILNSLGIISFQQLGTLGDDDLEELSERVAGIGQRIRRGRWVQQASRFAKKAGR